MTRFPSLTPDTAQGAARSLLGDLVARHGEIGAMVATMANSPAVLGGYLDLNRAMKRSKLPRHITERISLAVQQRQGCALCLAAHISAARAAGVIDSEIAEAREGTSADPAIAAIVAFGLQVYAAPATITDDQITGLRRYGYTDRQIIDVVGIVAINVLTGAFNLVAGLQPAEVPSSETHGAVERPLS